MPPDFLGREVLLCPLVVVDMLKSGRGVDIRDRRQASCGPIRHQKSGVHSSLNRASDWRSLAAKLIVTLPCG